MLAWLTGDRVIPAAGLRGKAVAITGCDSGFGFQTALSLAQLGMHVHAGCLTGEGAKQLESRHSRGKASEGSLTTHMLDVTSDASVAAFAAAIAAHSNGALFAAIANAGIACGGPIEILPMEVHKSIFDVNYFGVLRTLRACAPLLRKQARSDKKFRPRFIAISSISGSIAAPGIAAYSASKHACSAITLAARIELNQFGIDVTAVEPYFARTPIVAMDWARQHQHFLATSEEVQAAYGEGSKDEKVAGLNKLLASPLTMTPDFVVENIVKCVRRVALRPKYPVGLFAFVLLFLKYWTPYWMFERLLKKDAKKGVVSEKTQ
ncbi:hypothetical protein BC830DRAFT_1155088 [Chytriomyces sp. MP71]|nr:hypothetical protein BC830DRAFT_1155088 [Chytriomyces sp. MP71]